MKHVAQRPIWSQIDAGLVGAVAEWLRSGLQSRLHRFDSGPRLQPFFAEN